MTMRKLMRSEVSKRMRIIFYVVEFACAAGFCAFLYFQRTQEW